MPFKFNPFSGTLDIVNPTASGSGVVGIAPTTDKAITRWSGTSANVIQNSKAIAQDGGALQAQAFVQSREISDLVEIPTNYTMIASNVEIEDGSILIEDNGELLII